MRLLICSILLFSFSLSGCFVVDGTESGIGSMTVHWTFDGVPACPEDVDDVIIQITGLADQVVDCADGQIDFNELIVGNYQITILGVIAGQDEDIVTWESTVIPVDVRADSNMSIDINLMPL